MISSLSQKTLLDTIKPASKHLNDVILSDAKHLASSE
jgi:hypothetical protein